MAEATDDDDAIDGEDEPCGHEPDAEYGTPPGVLYLRELLPYIEAPQHKDPVSGSSQASAVKAHRAICRAVATICDAISREITDAG